MSHHCAENAKTEARSAARPICVFVGPKLASEAVELLRVPPVVADKYAEGERRNYLHDFPALDITGTPRSCERSTNGCAE